MAERVTFVPLVKAYPTPSERYGEAVCVAGARVEGGTPKWMRLYPVPFRDLPDDLQFAKYDVLDLDVLPHSDWRPESHRPVVDTLRLVGHHDTKDAWRTRREIVEPMLVESMCALRARSEADHTSLGAFRPHEVLDLVPSPEAGDWSEDQLASLTRVSLFAQDRSLLRKMPWRFRYHYTCDGRCRHEQTVIDWEIYATYLPGPPRPLRTAGDRRGACEVDRRAVRAGQGHDLVRREPARGAGRLPRARRLLAAEAAALKAGGAPRPWAVAPRPCR